MKKIITLGFPIVVILMATSTNAAGKTCDQWHQQGVLFCDGFEQEINASADNHLQWQAPYKADSNRFGMMFGPGDIYTRSSEQVHGGEHALRLNFQGRNGMCNECGFDFINAEAGTAPTHEMFAPDGQDLSRAPFHQPDASRAIYNIHDKFSKWLSVQGFSHNSANDALVAHLVQNDMGGDGKFKSDGRAALARQCGIDGNVGNDINRRSDCNKAINWIEGMTDDMHKPGETLYIRYYFYVPEATVMPNISFKLGYFRTQASNYKNSTSQIPVIYAAGTDSSRADTFHTEGDIGALEGIKTFKIAPFKFERNQWYYFEQAFTRSSSEGARDGRYRLWLNKIGYDRETGEPLTPELPDAVFDVSGFVLEKVKNRQGISIPGNWPHTLDAQGYMYFDNVVIANQRIGNR